MRLLMVAIPLMLAAAARGDAIELRRSVEAPHGPVRLGDVAALDGPRAEALAGVVLVEDAQLLPKSGGAHRLDLALVRGRLEDEPGVNWAFLTLRGGDVRLSPANEPVATGVSAEAPAGEAAEPDGEVDGAEAAPGTIRALARDVLLKTLRVEPEDLRVDWPGSERELLDEPVAGRLIHVQPRGTSARMPLAITIYDGDRIVRDETVRAEIRVRRSAHVMSRPVHRRTRLTPEDTTARVMWLGPGVAPAPEVAGKVTTRRLEPGSVVEVGDVAPPYVVERGEKIMLHCIAGGVVIRTEARALDSARDGELIEAEMTAGGKRVTARMNGRGRAVLVVRATAAPALRPTEDEVRP